MLPKDSLKDKRIIEIGSGCGIPGLIAAHLGAQVVLTELGEEMDLLKRNISLNIDRDSPIASRITTDELFWGTSTSHLSPPFDVILGADVVYEIQLFDQLIQSLCDLSGPDTIIYIALEHRWKDIEGWFFKDLTKHFAIQRTIPLQEMHPSYQLSQIDIYELKKEDHY